MPDKVECVDCCCKIPGDTERPEYVVLATRKSIRPRARCEKCRDAYEEKRLQTRNPNGGLKLVTMFLLVVSLAAAIGCAPSGPWLFSTEADREELLLKEGMTVKECTTKKGDPLLEAHYNPRALESYFVLSSDFTGVAYFQIKGSWSNEEVHFEAGRVVSIKYVRAPWMKY